VRSDFIMVDAGSFSIPSYIPGTDVSGAELLFTYLC
jgi:hypothetical protein